MLSTLHREEANAHRLDLRASVLQGMSRDFDWTAWICHEMSIMRWRDRGRHEIPSHQEIACR